jgi:hypothetical protein
VAQRYTRHFDRVSHAAGARAPYSLEPVTFPFPALAALSGRAALGGPREIALACLMASRLVSDACDSTAPLTLEQRRARAAGARHWLGASTLPAPIRAAISRLVEATGAEPKTAIQAALDSVIAVTANHLEQAARLELSKLAQAIAE